MSHSEDGSHDSHTQPEVKAIGRIGDWPLDPHITFLNHGSFGSSPKAVLEEQLRLRTELEAQPIEFLVRQLEGRLDEAKAHLATFLKAHPSNLSFIPNATHGVNTVLRSLRFQPGDELLTTNHAYNACTNALRFVAEQFQAVVRVAQIPTPLDDPMEVCEHLQRAVTPKTRLLLIDHVTSPTALIFPIQEIVTQMKRQGILCLVDGAHAPGMVPLHLSELGADFYTGNCHKWLCAPKGAAFLHVSPDHSEHIRPLSISHGANASRTDRSRHEMEFDWTGTADPTAYLCVPTAIEWMAAQMPGGWPAIMKRNRDLAQWASSFVESALGWKPLAPASMIGSMASMRMPDSKESCPPSTPLYSDPFQDQLWQAHQMEIPIIPWPHHPNRLVRLSAQLYNEPAHYHRLCEVMNHYAPSLQ